MNDDLWTKLGLESGDFVHWKATNADDGALFKEFMNTKGGTIVASWNFGKQQPNALSRFSDICFLGWKQLCMDAKVPLNSLHTVIRHPITNKETNAVIAEVIKRLHINPGKYPGNRILMGTPEGHALLGTPNGYGIAWMIIDHEKDFEGLTILSIHIMYERTMFPSLLFTIGKPSSPMPAKRLRDSRV